MANDQNQCNFTGRFGADPEQRFTPSGTAVTTGRIAVGKSFKDKDGNRQERTEWIPLVAWRGTADYMAKYCKKGTFIRVTGEFQTRKWQDRDGNDRYTSEIVVSDMQILSGGVSKDQNSNSQSGSGGMNEEPTFNPSDEIPFKLPMFYQEVIK